MEPAIPATGEAAVLLAPSRQLSPMQRALLASHLAHPDQPAQSMVLLSHLDGPIDPERLARAFAAVVAANDVLRTRIGLAGSPSIEAVGLADVDDLPTTEIVELDRAGAEDWARRRAVAPLDLTRCGWDSAVAHHPDGTASWYLNLNHVITDATSSALVFAQTAAAYHGTDPTPDRSYYDWARQLTGALDIEAGPAARAVAHWRDRERAPGVGRLYRAPGRPTPMATRLPLDLGGLLDRARARLADDYRMLTEQLAWSTLLVTAAALWTHRLTGADRFAVGLPVHNRTDPECRDLIGPTMEVFPVDVEIEPGDTGRTLHRRVGRSLMRTLGHAVPGTAPAPDHEIVVNVIPRAEQSHFGPIPATTHWLHTGAIDGSHLARLQMTAYAPTGADQPADGGPSWDFALDLSDGAADPDHRATAPDHLLAALRALVDEPDAPLSAWGLCLPTELAELDRWGRGPDLAPAEQPLLERLRTALATTDTTMVEDGSVELTGPELLAWVEATAAWMGQRGVVVGDRVGVDLVRSAEAVVAILATLTVGASFVPLDPAQPVARRRRLADRAGCRLVIDRPATVTGLRPTASTSPSPPPAAGDAADADGQREAYVIFTSGSTGEPKGVPITVDGLDRYLRFAADRYTGGERPPVVAPLFTPLTFDLTVTSLFLPLLTGGRLVAVAEDGPRGLAEVARRTDLTWVKATPSHLEILTRLLPADHRLAVLVVGGEAFGTRLAADLLADRPQLEIHNEYGPTEAVVGCMDYRVEPELLADQAEVPIGGPAPGVTLAVVDGYGHPVPMGAPGELLIAHPGLTAGYLTADADTDANADPDTDADPDPMPIRTPVPPRPIPRARATRSSSGRVGDGTGRATWSASRTGSAWSTSAGSTSRSRSGASASNRWRSRRRWPAIRPSSAAPSDSGRRRPRPRAPTASGAACPTTSPAPASTPTGPAPPATPTTAWPRSPPAGSAPPTTWPASASGPGSAGAATTTASTSSAGARTRPTPSTSWSSSGSAPTP